MRRPALPGVKDGLAAILLVAILAVLALKPIFPFTADLGRHLTNGRLLSEGIFKNPGVLFKNLYSYTNADFPFLNHHWGSGLVFHWISMYGGFEALSLSYFFLLAGAMIMTFWVTRRTASFSASVASALVAVPLLAYRSEVRPEAFSYFFAALSYLILSHRRNPIWLPVIMVLWVNLHIQFVLGFLLMASHLVERYYEWKADASKSAEFRRLSISSAISISACAVTPLGYHLLLFPFHFFTNYGYRVVENQSLWFYITHDFKFAVLRPGYALFLTALGALAFLSWKKPGFFPKNASFWIAVGGLILGFFAIRNLAVLALFAMPVMAEAFDRARTRARVLIFLPGVFACATFYPSVNPGWVPTLGIGLTEKSASAVYFFKSNGLRGPIFNNYDIGSYLIYHLYPNEKVFVDNRPEAYPASFFDDVYIPIQEDAAAWNDAVRRFGFRTIFFYRLDLTPWTQKFLIARVQDPDWAPVYVDRATIIFLRRCAENSALISKYEIPRSRFGF